MRNIRFGRLCGNQCTQWQSNPARVYTFTGLASLECEKAPKLLYKGSRLKPQLAEKLETPEGCDLPSSSRTSAEGAA
jgi:hypothetical protein